ncbi:DUF885 domain-containing protein [Spongiimicrobium salis]|uniref:DUF885 domain-containing protein n=1 Tax=Spongiimicrobium salis TaxID=1667022 RepID=UPI00374CBC42
MKNYFFLFVFFVIPFANCQDSTSASAPNFETFAKHFREGFEKWNLPPTQLSYVANLQSIKSEDSVIQQEVFFKKAASYLSEIHPEDLSKKNRLDFELMRYETEMNLLRIAQEKKWHDAQVQDISNSGIFLLPNGKELYTYFLKRWVGLEVTPDQMYQFGLKEIERVKKRMKTVQTRAKMDDSTFKTHINTPDFYYEDVEVVQEEFEKIKKIIAKGLAENFPDVDLIPEVKIARGTNKNLAQVPAFYRNETFYYNFFDQAFNKRQISWIYIHEAMPGHHYQIMLENMLERSDIQKMFQYSSYREGWAAYVEEIGYEIGAYRDIYDELGKWEWDIIRSVRVAMDVGINYYGWNDQKALKFWQQHIPEQDSIGLREIARMKRWPCQVITYKYGADKILTLKAEFEKQKDFNLKRFHQMILENGSLPFSILENIIASKK